MHLTLKAPPEPSVRGGWSTGPCDRGTVGGAVRKVQVGVLLSGVCLCSSSPGAAEVGTGNPVGLTGRKGRLWGVVSRPCRQLRHKQTYGLGVHGTYVSSPTKYGRSTRLSICTDLSQYQCVLHRGGRRGMTVVGTTRPVKNY